MLQYCSSAKEIGVKNNKKIGSNFFIKSTCGSIGD